MTKENAKQELYMVYKFDLEYEDFKILGIFSTKQKAQDAIDDEILGSIAFGTQDINSDIKKQSRKLKNLEILQANGFPEFVNEFIEFEKNGKVSTNKEYILSRIEQFNEMIDVSITFQKGGWYSDWEILISDYDIHINNLNNDFYFIVEDMRDELEETMELAEFIKKEKSYVLEHCNKFNHIIDIPDYLIYECNLNEIIRCVWCD